MSQVMGLFRSTTTIGGRECISDSNTLIPSPLMLKPMGTSGIAPLVYGKTGLVDFPRHHGFRGSHRILGADQKAISTESQYASPAHRDPDSSALNGWTHSCPGAWPASTAVSKGEDDQIDDDWMSEIYPHHSASNVGADDSPPNRLIRRPFV